MIVVVDGEACVGHGRCFELAPELFAEDEQGRCRLLQRQATPDCEELAQRAVANCPEGAISIVDDQT